MTPTDDSTKAFLELANEIMKPSSKRPPAIPTINIPLEEYIFMLVCRSKYNWATIDQAQKNRIVSCPLHEDYCHIEEYEWDERTKHYLYRLWRNDHWTAELERRARDQAQSDASRKASVELAERRQCAIERLCAINPAMDTTMARTIVTWCLEGIPEMEQTKNLLGL